jgi:hypothetical protein
MAEKVRVIPGFHAHLPETASDAEFDALWEKKLKPFLTALNANEAVQAALHFSGTLLERLEKKYPEVFLLIQDLTKRKQVEILGGAYYEPLLPLIPQTDKIGQIELYSTYVSKRFNKKPQGCLLARCAWEQSLVGALNSCGMFYTFLKADQFRFAGIDGDGLFSPWITEDLGKLVTVFPFFSFFNDEVYKAKSGARVLAAFPEFQNDSEAEIGRFFDKILRDMRDKKIECALPGKMYRSGESLGRACFAPSPDTDPRRVLIRHPEANLIYAKSFFLHGVINQLHGDKERKKAAREELWKAEAADVLSDEGIAQSSLRRNAWRALLGAERVTRDTGKTKGKTRDGDFKPSLLAFDFDLDGETEYLFQDKNVNCYVKARGASLFEFDFLPKGWNCLDGYSETDERGAFADFLKMGADAEAGETVSLAAELFDAQCDRQKNRASFSLVPKKPFDGLLLEKIYRLEKNILSVSYSFANRGPAAEGGRAEKIAFCFSPRCFFSFNGAETGLASPAAKKGQAEIDTVTVSSAKSGAELSLSADKKFEFEGSRVETGGVFRSIKCEPLFRICLEPGEAWSVAFKLSVALVKAQ